MCRRIVKTEEGEKWRNRTVQLPTDYEDRLPSEWSEDGELRITNPEFTITGNIEESGSWVSLVLEESGETILEKAASYGEPDEETRAAVREKMYQVAWELHQFDGSTDDIARQSYSEYEASETGLENDPIREELPHEPLTGIHLQALEDVGYGPVLPVGILPEVDEESMVPPDENKDRVVSMLVLGERPREIAFNMLTSLNPKPEAAENAWHVVWEGTARNGATLEEVWEEYGSPLAHRSNEFNEDELMLDIPTSLEEAREFRRRIKE